MSEPHRDSRILPRDRCVVRDVLDRHARERPDKVFIRTARGHEVTYRQLRDEVLKTASALAEMGVRQDDFVMSWLPNGIDIIKVFLAANYLGAVHVPINTAYRGRLLEYVIQNSGASVIVAHRDLIPRLAEIDRGQLAHVVSIGGAATEKLPGQTLHAADVLDRPARANLDVARPIEPWDTQSIIYTSGTTGPSKGVISSYFHLWSMGHATCYYVDETDRSFCYLPFFHAASLAGLMKMLCEGGSIGLVEQFETAKFWTDLNFTGSTTCMIIGSVSTFLAKQGQTDEERRTTLKTLLGAPLTADAREIARRSGLVCYACWNMTETSSPIVSGPNPSKPGTCGVVRAGATARLVDENDCEVAVGTVGELILRTDAPWAMNSRYHKDPEATARAWRNGWFHSGDAFKMDADGDFFFVDRIKDAIRRRGENISSMEVEREVNAYTDVAESAVVAVPSEYGEDEVLVVVVPRPGKTLDGEKLLEFLVPRMAHFMVPRYFRFLDQLPKTPTGKIEKHRLRTAGVTDDTWDREAQGLKLKRERLGAA